VEDFYNIKSENDKNDAEITGVMTCFAYGQNGSPDTARVSSALSSSVHSRQKPLDCKSGGTEMHRIILLISGQESPTLGIFTPLGMSKSVS
jgi:hypothetical protein